jgi:hypothetical protein
MDVPTALHYISKVSYKPQWRLYAMPIGEGNDVMLTVDYVAWNSNSELAPDYFEKARNMLRFDFSVADLDTPEQVYRVVLNCLLECERHETTEFFKVGRFYASPFHPHTEDGRALLARTEGVAKPLPS